MRDLVAWWLMNEGNADFVFDSSRNGNSGIAQGMSQSNWVPDESGVSLDFNGVDEHVITTKLGTFGRNFCDAFTISLWVKTTDTTTGALCGTMSVGPSTLLILYINRYYDGVVHENENGALYCQVRDNAERFLDLYITGQTMLTDGNWHHIALDARLKSNTGLFYVDGVPIIASTERMESPDNSIDFQYPLPLGGRNNRGVIDAHFKGKIKDFRIHGSRLNTSQVRALYERPYERFEREIPVQTFGRAGALTKPVYLGSSQIDKMYLGSTEIQKAYLGNTEVFDKG